MVWFEALAQLPFFFVAAYAFAARKNWIREFTRLLRSRDRGTAKAFMLHIARVHDLIVLRVTSVCPGSPASASRQSSGKRQPYVHSLGAGLVRADAAARLPALARPIALLTDAANRD
jgi:hypothetical protein